MSNLCCLPGRAGGSPGYASRFILSHCERCLFVRAWCSKLGTPAQSRNGLRAGGLWNVRRPSLIPGRVSVGGPGYPSLTAAILALDRIDFATGLHWLHYRRKSGAIACRTFVLDRFHGWLSHLNLSGVRLSCALWIHHDVAGLAMEVGAILGCNNLKAMRDGLNGWHVVVFALRQASHTSLLADRAP